MGMASSSWSSSASDSMVIPAARDSESAIRRSRILPRDDPMVKLVIFFCLKAKLDCERKSPGFEAFIRR